MEPDKARSVNVFAPRERRVPVMELALFTLASLILLASTGSYFNVVERVFAFAARYEAVDLDEILGALLLLPLLSTVFLYLRNRRSRAAMVHTRRLAAAILDGIPDAVTVSDTEGLLVYLNPAARKLIAATPWQDDFAGVHIHDLYAPECREKTVPEALEQATAAGIWSGDLNRVAGDGHLYPAADVLISHKDDAGQPQYISIISRNLTNRVALERQLQHKQKLEAVGQLAGGVAHQYNNMLMVIAGNTRRAMKLMNDVPDAETPLKEVLRTVDLAAEMTRNLLLFTRHQPLEKRAVKVSKALADVKTLVDPLLDERYSLEVRIEDADARVETDSGEMVQAIMNLAVNARDAMPGGGTIEIHLQSVTFDTPTSVGSPDELPAGDYIQISVQDAGTGIDRPTREKLFEPFFTTKEPGKGTGLGLAMVLGFSQASGGTVAVDSTAGQGSTFYMYLPKTNEQPYVAAAPVAGDTAGQGETILLVEDNNALREIVAEMLGDFGYQVLAAADGFEAIEIEQEHEDKIDLLLTDVLMPDISGPQVHRIIQQQRPDIPTVFISGYPGKEAIETLPEGATLLRKPVDPTDLARTIRATLERKAKRAAVAC